MPTFDLFAKKRLENRRLRYRKDIVDGLQNCH